jgi:hypothetical protein
MTDSRLRLRYISSAVVIASGLLGAGCAGARRVATEEFVGVRADASMRVAVVFSVSENLTDRVDVYRVLEGRLLDVWPATRVTELPAEVRGALQGSKVRLVTSWRSENRIDDLWPASMDGSVLAHEWRGGQSSNELLVMRDGAGRVLWVLGPDEVFPPEERGHFEARGHSYDWIEEASPMPNGREIRILGKGGVSRAIGIQDGAVRRISGE